MISIKQELLIRYLNFAGFKDIKKVDEFGLFDDTSSMRFAGTLISLNLVVIKLLWLEIYSRVFIIFSQNSLPL